MALQANHNTHPAISEHAKDLSTFPFPFLLDLFHQHANVFLSVKVGETLQLLVPFHQSQRLNLQRRETLYPLLLPLFVLERWDHIRAKPLQVKSNGELSDDTPVV